MDKIPYMMEMSKDIKDWLDEQRKANRVSIVSIIESILRKEMNTQKFDADLPGGEK